LGIIEIYKSLFKSKGRSRSDSGNIKLSNGEEDIKKKLRKLEKKEEKENKKKKQEQNQQRAVQDKLLALQNMIADNTNIKTCVAKAVERANMLYNTKTSELNTNSKTLLNTNSKTLAAKIAGFASINNSGFNQGEQKDFFDESKKQHDAKKINEEGIEGFNSDR